MAETRNQKQDRILANLIDDYFKGKSTLKESAFRTFQDIAEKESGKFN